MIIRNIVKTILIIGFWFVISLSAFSVEINGSANIYFTNNYFWRVAGIENLHTQYDFALSTSIGGLDISLSPWISYDLDLKEVNEVDYIIDLRYAIGDASLNVGAIYYDVTGIPETTEIYGGLGYDIGIADLVSISPGIKFYYDIQEIKAGYLEPSISIGTPKFEYISASAILGYDLGQFVIDDKDESKLTTLQLGVSGSYEIMKKISISPSFTYVLGLTDGIDNTSYAGLKISFEF